MNFSSCEHTKYVWEEISKGLRDRQKPQGSRFLGNNNLSKKSVNDILDALATNFSDLGTVSTDRLNAK